MYNEQEATASTEEVTENSPESSMPDSLADITDQQLMEFYVTAEESFEGGKEDSDSEVGHDGESSEAEEHEVHSEETEGTNSEEPSEEAVDYSSYKGAIGEYTPEQVAALIDMGTRYNPEMNKLKPSLALVKMLEDNGLNDPTKLNHLIDVAKSKPEAIAALIKKAGIDVYSLNLDGEEEYVPEDHSVSVERIELDRVVDEVVASDSGNKTLTIITKEWDAKSREMLVNNPAVIKLINEQVGNGVYDRVAQEVSKRRMFGEFTDVPDVIAYQRVGQELYEQATQEPSKAAASKPIQKAKPKQSQVARKRSASIMPKSNGGYVPQSEDNLLKLSDEELMKAIDF